MLNHTSNTPEMGNNTRNEARKIEPFTPIQLSYQLEELFSLTTAAYWALDGVAVKGDTRTESGVYIVGLVASKLEDLLSHYERLVDEISPMSAIEAELAATAGAQS